jgi:hypothetical protein
MRSMVTTTAPSSRVCFILMVLFIILLYLGDTGSHEGGANLSEPLTPNLNHSKCISTNIIIGSENCVK